VEDQIARSDWRADNGMEWYAGRMTGGNALRLIRNGRETTRLRTGPFKLEGEWGTNMNGAGRGGRPTREGSDNLIPLKEEVFVRRRLLAGTAFFNGARRKDRVP
jgi:hypothetical protein